VNGWTLLLVVGAWLALALLSVAAYRFNRSRADD
jgi:hypothetical protein